VAWCLVGCRPAAPLRVAAAGDLQLGATLTSTPFAVAAGGDVRALLDGGLRLVNLEGPLTERSDGVRDHFAFAPARAEWLRDRVDVASLANNHALDQGPAGRDDTMRALAAVGVAAAFDGHDATLARAGARVTVIARAFSPDADLDGSDGDALVAAVARAPKPALVSLHWGHTGVVLPDGAQRRLASRLVDAGASAILGHGPHAPQGVERRGRAVVAYSLGNFAFGCDCTDGADAYVLGFTLAADGTVSAVTLTPIVAGLSAPPARAHDADLTALLAALSRDLGSDAVVDGDLVRVR
jgi:poly-gamma-glutamate synthesis protein (capsule biosynthesis protein)